MNLLEHLNEPQREAVEHLDGPMLILAGAGSGKTRVITRRMTHMVCHAKIHPSHILAVTFTNKAAREMRERVDVLLDDTEFASASSDLTISTFHSLGARLLRRHADRLGLTWSFNIYDDADQQRLIRELLRAQDKDAALQASVRAFKNYLEKMKNCGITPRRAHELAFNKEDEEHAYLYEDYQRALRQANCLDFGDLIMGVLEVFRDDEELAHAYSNQWRYIMVDEFQDTNPAQYEMLRHLTSQHSNFAVVGDDDQAIYRWRGATIANILGFEGDFAKTRVVKLEQNYRSTQVILDVANDIIKHNPGRRDKKLWTTKEGGNPVVCFTAYDDREEAHFVANRIRLLAHRGASWSDFSVFFRTNAQARQFEEQLRFAGVPYQILGGTSFYQREEIKDILAYLKVALNPVNQVDVMRVINTPSRGVGASTVRKLIQGSLIPGIDTVFNSMRYVIGADMTFEGDVELITPDPQDLTQDQDLDALERIKVAQTNGIRDFYQTIQTMRDELVHFDSLADVVRQFIEHIHYFDYIKAKHPDVAEDKQMNVAELVNAIEEFERDWDRSLADGEDLFAASQSVLSDSIAVLKLRAFLDQSALIQSADQLQDSAEIDKVTLMTVHGSKGLEFDTVFLAGMEDELFPSIRDHTDAEEEHEERRLAYVAVTRARKNLFITNAKRRRVYGQFKDTTPSRFLFDVDPKHIMIDPKSSAKVLNWTLKKASMKKKLTDEDLYFSDHGVDFAFDQSPNMECADDVSYDEFAQVAPDETQISEAAPGLDSSTLRRARHAKHESLVGKTVTHVSFGIGKVLQVSGAGDKAVLTVNFPARGQKKIVRKFLKILG